MPSKCAIYVLTSLKKIQGKNQNLEKNFENCLPAIEASKIIDEVTSRLPEYLGLPILESPFGSIVRSMCDAYSPPIP